MILPTENEGHGYFNTISDSAEPSRAWDFAFQSILDATRCGPDEVRAFLDSRHGRHFADDVRNKLLLGHAIERAVEMATAQWMRWRVTAHVARRYHMPVGEHYLTAFVILAGVEAI